jgi:hypothetical protein
MTIKTIAVALVLTLATWAHAARAAARPPAREIARVVHVEDGWIAVETMAPLLRRRVRVGRRYRYVWVRSSPDVRVMACNRCDVRVGSWVWLESDGVRVRWLVPLVMMSVPR